MTERTIVLDGHSSQTKPAALRCYHNYDLIATLLLLISPG